MSRSMLPTPQHNGMVQSWPGNPGVTDPFLAPSASPGSRRQVSVPIPFREAEVEHSPMPTPMRIVCTTYSPSSRSPVLNSCRLKTTHQLSFRGEKTTGSTRPGLAYPRRGLPRITLALKSLSDPELPKNGLGRPPEQERCQSRWKGRGTVFA